MELIKELKARAQHIIGPVIGISFVVYFGYHVMHGDRGLIALRQLSQVVESTKLVHDNISNKRIVLAKRVSLLYPSSLDPDMLEERARVMLNYGYSDDIVIIINAVAETSASPVQTVSFSTQN